MSSSSPASTSSGDGLVITGLDIFVITGLDPVISRGMPIEPR